MEKERNEVRKSYMRVNMGSQLCIWRDSEALWAAKHPDLRSVPASEPAVL